MAAAGTHALAAVATGTHRASVAMLQPVRVVDTGDSVPIATLHP